MSTQHWFGIALGMVLALSMAPADAQSRRGYHHGRGGCEAIVYQHEGFRGEQLPITGSTPTLGDRWNDRISSIRVISGDWTFYQHDGYRGDQVRVGRDVPDVGKTWNDRISSARCDGRGGWGGGWGGWGDDDGWQGGGRGCEAIVYRDSGFRGEQRRLSGDTPWVGDHWNDRISSIRVLSGRWIFYGDRDYRGSELPVGRRDDVPSLAGGWNDRISSARCVG